MWHLLSVADENVMRIAEAINAHIAMRNWYNIGNVFAGALIGTICYMVIDKIWQDHKKNQ